MKLHSYLSRSRHGVYYFRWTIPTSLKKKRTTLRISLRTRCHNQAGNLARYLTCCGQHIWGREDLARLRQDQIRELMADYFQSMLQQYNEKLNDTGFSEEAIESMRMESRIHQQALEGPDHLSDQVLSRNVFCEAVGISFEDWNDSLPSIRTELRKGRRDMLKEVLEAIERLERYSFNQSTIDAPTPATAPLKHSSELGQAVKEYIEEHSRQWAPKTIRQNSAYLRILTEFFGPNRLLSSITKRDAHEVKRILQQLPSSRSTKPQLKTMPLMEVIKVCPSSEFLGPVVAQTKREFGSSDWFDYAACWR